MTQHIPDKDQHLIHYFGYYSNNQQGLRQKQEAAAERNRASAEREQPCAYIKQQRMSWAALIKKVYEIDPLRCPGPVLSLVAEHVEGCGGTMQIISFIEKCQPEVVEKILRHCGLWKSLP